MIALQAHLCPMGIFLYLWTSRLLTQLFRRRNGERECRGRVAFPPVGQRAAARRYDVRGTFGAASCPLAYRLSPRLDDLAHFAPGAFVHLVR